MREHAIRKPQQWAEKERWIKKSCMLKWRGITWSSEGQLLAHSRSFEDHTVLYPEYLKWRVLQNENKLPEDVFSKACWWPWEASLRPPRWGLPQPTRHSRRDANMEGSGPPGVSMPWRTPPLTGHKLDTLGQRWKQVTPGLTRAHCSHLIKYLSPILRRKNCQQKQCQQHLWSPLHSNLSLKRLQELFLGGETSGPQSDAARTRWLRRSRSLGWAEGLTWTSPTRQHCQGWTEPEKKPESTEKIRVESACAQSVVFGSDNWPASWQERMLIEPSVNLLVC